MSLEEFIDKASAASNFTNAELVEKGELTQEEYPGSRLQIFDWRVKDALDKAKIAMGGRDGSQKVPTFGNS
jgi:hypothetical protein